jgi:fermentation-respiration switch protein FrsA (DUF1100 family)
MVEQWNAYLDNSPLYRAKSINTPLLIAHGDRDGNVPFAQSVEIFNTLRRIGNKAVVLLQYRGEEHEISATAQRDFERRMDAVFDHFLLGAPAPSWWSDGVTYYEGEVPASESPELEGRHHPRTTN